MKKLSLAAASMLGLALMMSAMTDLRAAELKVLAGGSTTGWMNELAAQFERTSGHKLVIHFDSTPNLIKQVTSGAPIYQIDDDLQRADLNQSNASLLNAHQTFDRAQALMKTGSGTQANFDSAEASLRIAEARCASDPDQEGSSVMGKPPRWDSERFEAWTNEQLDKLCEPTAADIAREQDHTRSPVFGLTAKMDWVKRLSPLRPRGFHGDGLPMPQ